MTGHPVKTADSTDDTTSGRSMHALLTELYPICRSITGGGVRKTLEILKKHIPLTVHEVPTGTKVLDWTIPKEWNIRDAYIKNPHGEKIVDFSKTNLHVVSYSTPVDKKISLTELKNHLHTLEKYPDWIPYLTSYYHENWGFCLSHNQVKGLTEGEYEVKIDSSLMDGHLSYGEFLIKGESDEEILFSTYLCHPSLCNDNLSGVVLLTHLAESLIGKKIRYSYRFLFIPETIGAITWLSQNDDTVAKIKFGLVATCVGDSGISTYKQTRNAPHYLDRIVEKVLIDSGMPYTLMEFWPSGSDERQYSSPGYNIPVGSLMRTCYTHFPQYHTSADNLDFVTAEHLADSLKKYQEIIFIIEHDAIYINTNPKGEPQLGRRGLYAKIGGSKDPGVDELAVYWILNLSDGRHSLLDIAVRSKMPFRKIRQLAAELESSGLLVPASRA